MRREEVDRTRRRSLRMVELDRRAEQPLRHIPLQPRIAPPERPHIVACLVVPFAEREGEPPHLIAALANIPRLGDQLHLRKHRVLPDRREERPLALEPLGLAPQRGRQIEPEPIHMHHLHPVAQGIDHHPQHHRMRHVQGVAAAGRVEAVPLVLGQQVIGRVVDPPERQRRPKLRPLGGVVVDHVQDHLDPRLVQLLHHGLDLAGAARFQIGPVRRKEG